MVVPPGEWRKTCRIKSFVCKEYFGTKWMKPFQDGKRRFRDIYALTGMKMEGNKILAYRYELIGNPSSDKSVSPNINQE